MHIAKTKFVLVAAIFAVFALATGQLFWPPAPELPRTSAEQMVFFAGIAAVEAFAFGIGVSFLIFMRRFVRKKTGASFQLAFAGYLSVGWLLVSWWPHDNLHYHIGHDIQKLLYIEYGFHLTLVAAGFILAYLFANFLMRKE